MRHPFALLLILGAAGCAPATPGWCPAEGHGTRVESGSENLRSGTHPGSGSQNLRTGPDAAAAAGVAAIGLALAYASGANCP